METCRSVAVADPMDFSEHRTGIHKHFRMIAISEHLRNHGYDPRLHRHTSIPGIWAKLRTLYNLDLIDERENSFAYEDPEKYIDFVLPNSFEEDMLKRVLRDPEDGSQAASSPPRLRFSQSPEPPSSATPKPAKGKKADVNKRRGSTVEDTDEARTSPANSPKPARRGRGGNRIVGRMKAESRSRNQSKETTAEEDNDEQETEEVGDEDEDAEEEEDGTPSGKATKLAKSKPDTSTTRKSKRKR